MKLLSLKIIICYMVAIMASGALAKEQTPLAAQPLAADRYAGDCNPTPAIARYPYPGAANVYSSSKMARPAGKADYAVGQLLYVHGRVFDSACVPLKNAKVELWHADSNGRHAYAKEGALSNPYPLFTGAGMVSTDNEGAFMFETIFPAPLPNKPPLPPQAPYLNIRISHPLMNGALQSVIYFAGDARNNTDKSYNALSSETRRRITAEVAPYEAIAASPNYNSKNNLPTNMVLLGKPTRIAPSNMSNSNMGDSMAGNLPKGVLINHDITVNARDFFRKF